MFVYRPIRIHKCVKKNLGKETGNKAFRDKNTDDVVEQLTSTFNQEMTAIDSGFAVLNKFHFVFSQISTCVSTNCLSCQQFLKQKDNTKSIIRYHCLTLVFNTV